MRASRNRREFLSDVGRGMVVATIGAGTAADLGLASIRADDASAPPLTFGPLEPLVALLQETPADRIVATVVGRLRSGTDLRTLLAAAAMANARTFGGEDYVGFHTMMALAPAFHIAEELPPETRALPVVKVLRRNTARIQEAGGRSKEVLHPVEGRRGPSRGPTPCETPCDARTWPPPRRSTPRWSGAAPPPRWSTSCCPWCRTTPRSTAPFCPIAPGTCSA